MLVLEQNKIHLTIIGVRKVPKKSLPEYLQHIHLAINRAQIIFITFLFGTWFISIWCTILQAKDFKEFSQAFTYLVIGGVHSSFYYISLWKRTQLLTFINDFERAIEKSNI